MAWHLMSKMIVEGSAAHATLLGKWWIAFMFIFRFIFVASIGDTVYADEQSKFICNTKQPGCTQVCYNEFAPISHIRFWGFQILATGAPSIIFVVFSMHRLAMVPKKPEGEDATSDCATQTSWRYARSKSGLRKRTTTEKKALGGAHGNHKYASQESIVSPIYPKNKDKTSVEIQQRDANIAVVRAYILNVLFTTIAEGLCIFAQWSLYKWEVPEFYECIRYPCPKVVECYISRPMEKTIFLLFMFVIGGICLVLNFLEINYLGWKRIKHYVTVKNDEMFIQPSVVLGTYTEILDAAHEFPINRRRKPKKQHTKRAIPSAPTAERVLDVKPKRAPPGYYIPEKTKAQTNLYPNLPSKHIEVAPSFTTNETELSSGTGSNSSLVKVKKENVNLL